MQEWFQWGYDGQTAEEMHRMMIRASDDGRASDDDGYLLGEQDDGARCLGALPAVEEEARSRRRRRLGAGRAMRRTANMHRRERQHVSADIHPDRLRLDATAPTRYADTSSSSSACEDPPLLTAAAAPLYSAALPPVLFGHASAAFGDASVAAALSSTEHRPAPASASIMVIHGGSAGAQLASEQLHVGGSFVADAFVTTSATYVITFDEATRFTPRVHHATVRRCRDGVERPTDRAAPPTAVSTSGVDAPALFGHVVCPLRTSVAAGSAHEAANPTSFDFVVGFGSAAPCCTQLYLPQRPLLDRLWLGRCSRTGLSTSGGSQAAGMEWTVEWRSLNAVGATMPSARMHASLCGYDRPHKKLAPQSAGVAVSNLSELPEEGSATTNGVQPRRMLLFGGLGADGSALDDLYVVIANPDSETVSYIRVASGLYDTHLPHLTPASHQQRPLGESAIVASGYPPSARYGHSATWVPDGDSACMVVFGGVDAGRQYHHDCFALDVRAGWLWREILLPDAFRVPPRALHAAAWCGVKSAVVLVGGEVHGRAVAERWALRLPLDQWRLVEDGNRCSAGGTAAVTVERNVLPLGAGVTAAAVACGGEVHVVVVGGINRDNMTSAGATSSTSAQLGGRAPLPAIGELFTFGSSLKFFAAVSLCSFMETVGV